PRRREILELVEPVLAVRRVRATVDVQHERILLPRLVSVRLHEPALDLDTTHRVEHGALGVTERHLAQELVVEARETPLARAVPVRDVQLRRMRQVSRDERDLRLAVAAESVD